MPNLPHLMINCPRSSLIVSADAWYNTSVAAIQSQTQVRTWTYVNGTEVQSELQASTRTKCRVQSGVQAMGVHSRTHLNSFEQSNQCQRNLMWVVWIWCKFVPNFCTICKYTCCYFCSPLDRTTGTTSTSVGWCTNVLFLIWLFEIWGCSSIIMVNTIFLQQLHIIPG